VTKKKETLTFFILLALAFCAPLWSLRFFSPFLRFPTHQHHTMGASQFRENHYLNKEYAERMAAQQNLAMGNYTGGQSHDLYANQYGMKADQVHSSRYARGKTMMPFAQHGPTTGGLGYGAPLGAPLASSSMLGMPLMSTSYISPIETIAPAPIVTEYISPPTILPYDSGFGFLPTTTLGGAALSNYW
jgi:hypothetical protein